MMSDAGRVYIVFVGLGGAREACVRCKESGGKFEVMRRRRSLYRSQRAGTARVKELEFGPSRKKRPF
jgi:hypothetical protein